MTPIMNWGFADELKRDSIAQRWPVRTALWLFVAILLAGGWAAVVRQVQLERTEAEKAAILQAQNRATALEQYVTRTLEAADLVTLHLGYKYFIHHDLPAAAASGSKPLHIVDPVVNSDLFEGAHAVNPDGDLVATTLDLDRRTSVAAHPVYQAQLRISSAELQISRPLPSAFIPGQHVHASRRILDPAGRTLGFVDLQMSPSQLISFPESVSFKPTDLVSVISLDGITLARREGNRISSGENLQGRLVMQMQRRNPNGTYVGPSSIDGHVRYFSHRRLADLPVFVTAGVSRSDALAPANARARIYFAIMAVLSLVTVGIALLTLATLKARHRKAASLAEANRRLAEAQRVGKIGDWEYDVASGTILWSDQLCEMYERDPAADRVTVEEFRSYVHEDDIGRGDAALQRAFRTGEPQTCDIRITLPSGAVSDRHIIIVPISNADGRVIRLYGTDQDVSDDKLLHSLQAQVAHLARLDAMNMMASTLAHELNQPLTAASNYLTGSERLANLPGEANQSMLKEGLQLARRQIHTAADIIRRVREMVRHQANARASASLPNTIDDAIGLLFATGVCPKNLVQKNFGPDAEFVWADPVQVQQVVVNLLRNACEATDGEDRQVSISTRSGEDDFVTVEISDNGPGFSRPFSEIFSPFESEKMQGMGLGLSISRTIVEYHGGKIWVEKSDSSGTTIAFKLPKPEAPELQ